MAIKFRCECRLSAVQRTNEEGAYVIYVDLGHFLLKEAIHLARSEITSVRGNAVNLQGKNYEGNILDVI